ncbi:hypothetical protein [Acinetobacter gyllenbergii]|uniref:hypothetical protein n=1 Tax=Acinetobacter gyllenbergii TaxID=134534 RepID=UPI0003BE2A75|nr:hypothetical protein [Acinetobacter gyllenbergii]ESK44036.1 hypothetical protein F987_01962 [Acinetobacter gyllenbergii NIPH 230]
MKFLNEKIEISTLKEWLSDEFFEVWVHPRLVTGFEKKDIDTAELKYIENHYNSSEEISDDYEVVITDYLSGCLTQDSFNLVNEIYIKDFISAVLYLITKLYFSYAAYPLAWNGIYLVNKDNLDFVFYEIYEEFYSLDNNHLRNMLRVFCIELLGSYADGLNGENQNMYKEIEGYRTDNTYMY